MEADDIKNRDPIAIEAVIAILSAKVDDCSALVARLERDRLHHMRRTVEAERELLQDLREFLLVAYGAR